MKVFTLASNRCGYCRMLEQFVENKYPNMTEDDFVYFNLDENEPTEESEKVLFFAKLNLSTGVPFTVVINDDGSLDYPIKGFQMKSLSYVFDKVLTTKKQEEE